MHRVHTDNLDPVEKRALWDEIIQDFLSSGMTYPAYSKLHQLKYDQLSYYVCAYRKKQRALTQPPVQRLLPVNLVEASQAATAPQLWVRASNYEVGVSGHFQADTLKRLLAALSGATC